MRSELLADCTGPDCSKEIAAPYKDLIIKITGQAGNSVEENRTFRRELEIEKPSYQPDKVQPRSKITILNCFWPSNDPLKECVSLHKMKSASVQLPGYIPSPDEIPDRILNLTLNFNLGASINNKRFKYMNEPLSQGDSSHTKCSEDPTLQEKCTQIVTGTVQQMIVLTGFKNSKDHSSVQKFVLKIFNIN